MRIEHKRLSRYKGWIEGMPLDRIKFVYGTKREAYLIHIGGPSRPGREHDAWLRVQRIDNIDPWVTEVMVPNEREKLISLRIVKGSRAPTAEASYKQAVRIMYP